MPYTPPTTSIRIPSFRSTSSTVSSPFTTNPLTQKETANHMHSLPSAPVPHPVYFFDDGTVDLCVESNVFRLHRFFFERDSEFFQKLFAKYGRSTTELSVAGTRVYALPDVIYLEDNVKSVDLERFLGIIYPADFGNFAVKTVDEWTSVLRLSTIWGFASIRALAIKYLYVIAEPVDKVVLGRDFDVPKWLPEAYLAICDRPAPLTLDEGDRLGVKDVVRISQAREAMRTRNVTSTVQVREIVGRKLSVDLPAVPQPDRSVVRLLPAPMASADVGTSLLPAPLNNIVLDKTARPTVETASAKAEGTKGEQTSQPIGHHEVEEDEDYWFGLGKNKKRGTAPKKRYVATSEVFETKG